MYEYDALRIYRSWRDSTPPSWRPSPRPKALSASSRVPTARRALSHRFAYLVNEIGILPGNILCVTFTNKSANEMRQRIHRLTGDNDTGYINTFHGFCVSILQEDSNAVQYPKSFLVLDNRNIDGNAVTFQRRGA